MKHVLIGGLFSLGVALAAFFVQPLGAADDKKPDPPAKEEIEKEQKALEGVWRMEALLEPGGGKNANVESMLYVFHKDQVLLYQNNQLTSQCTLKFDLAQKPKRLDMMVVDKKYAYHKGIYELNGDKLTYCVAFGHDDYPTELGAKKKPKEFMQFEMKRAAKLDDPAAPVLGLAKPFSAEELAKAFAKDQKKSTEQFDKKFVIFEGTVVEVGKPQGTPHFVLLVGYKGDGKTLNVRCPVPFPRKGEIADLKAGDKVKLTGYSPTVKNEVVEFDDCARLK